MRHVRILSMGLSVAAFDKPADFNALIQEDTSARDFKPPGVAVYWYTSKKRQFEIWMAEFTDQAVRDIISRMQILISFFIEGGTPLELNDEEWTQARWRVFFL